MNTPHRSHKTARLPALVAGVLLVLNATTFAATISGTVTDAGSGAPIARAAVVFVAADGSASAASTNGEGAYSLTLADGTYTRRVQVPGYSLGESQIQASGATSVDFSLSALVDVPKPLPTFGLPTQNATLVADPGSAGVFYAGSGFANTLYRTFDAGESWAAVTRISEDPRGIVGTFQGFLRPTITTSGVAGEVATVSLATDTASGQVWFSRDYGTTWTEVGLPAGRNLEPSGTSALRWVHVPGGAEFLVLQPAGHDTTLWVADPGAPEPAFIQLGPASNPLAVSGAKYWDAWNLDGTAALAAVKDDGSLIDVYVWTNNQDRSSLARLGNSIGLSPAVTGVSFFDVGGINGNVMVIGGVDQASPYPWPQTFGLIAKPALDANFNDAFVRVQAVDINACYLAGTGIVAPTATHDEVRALVGVSACPVLADPSDTQTVSLGGASGAIMPAYDGGWDGAGNQTVLGIAGRGIVKATSASGSPAGPAFGSADKVEGITAPQVRATTFGPAGPNELAMALDSAGGKRIIASDDGGVSFVSLVDAGGYAIDWWRGATGDWLVAGHSGAEAGLLSAVRDWTSAAEPLALPNLPSANQLNLSPENTNSDVRALLGVTGTDTVFVGTFQYPGYMGSLYRGSVAGGDFVERVRIVSSNEAHPLATIQDLAYCPAEGSAPSVADTLFVATGYLGLVNGGLYAVREALSSAEPVATPVAAFPFAERAVTDVVVDCQTGALTVGAASDPGVFRSSDGGVTFDNVHFPDTDDGIPGDDTFQAAAIDANPENPDHIVVIANESDDSVAAGFMFETTDGGETWNTVVDPSAVDDNGNHLSENTIVNDIALPPDAEQEPGIQSLAALRRGGRQLRTASLAQREASFAPLALGTQAGGAARAVDVGARRSAPGVTIATGATGGNGRIRIEWEAPEDAGSRPISGYTARCTASGKPTRTANADDEARQVDVSNLARGTRYLCNVRALSVLGVGAASDNVQATTFNVPDAPRRVAGIPLVKAVRLTYAAPTSTGGTPITRYKATCTAPGKPTRSAEKSGTSLTVSGLLSKVSYRCSVQARNALGLGAASTAVKVTTK